MLKVRQVSVAAAVGNAWSLKKLTKTGSRQADAGIEPIFDSNPETFRQSLASDVALWAPVVKALGLKID